MKLLSNFCYGNSVQLIGTFADGQTLTKVESQDKHLQLTKVKTANAELTWYMAKKKDKL